jgi:DNA-binding NtrC family response regulator
MTKIRNIGKRSIESGDDLRAQVHFSPETGQLWLHEHRMLMVHAEAQAAMHEELIETLGMDQARRIIFRTGYASGVRDVELVCTRAQGASDLEIFMTGPYLHTLEGIVKVTPIKVKFDRQVGTFYGEFLWENSWEGQWHRRQYGVSSQPTCWSQIGYACGYTSAFMGRPVLYKEAECCGMGDNNCRIVGKPLDQWDDAADYARYFDGKRESIAEQLIGLQTQVVQLRSAINEKEKLPADIMGNSPAFLEAYELLRRAAQSQITVLLLGETGVGKEVFARSLHEMGSRKNASFVAVNCAAIPHDLVEAELFGVEKGAYTGALASRPGRFERASGGTLFLDEIGELPLSAQAKLLRVLQEGEIERLGDHKSRKIDVRVVTATNIDLRLLVRDGKFRSDLYYRLNAFQIDIPPLRERKQDISLLAKNFLEKYSALQGKSLRGFTDKAKRALLSYSWPGNIRELKNVVERGVILAQSGTRIELDLMFSNYGQEVPELGINSSGDLEIPSWKAGEDLCDAVFDGVMTLDQIEAMLVRRAVDKARGNLSSAARMLGLTRRQIAYRLSNLREDEEGVILEEADLGQPGPAFHETITKR